MGSARLGFKTRLRAIRKLLFRADPFIMIAVKPKDMVQPRPPTYEIAPLAALLNSELQDYKKLIRSCEAHREAAAEAYRAIGPNGYFNETDAFATFSLVRELRPARVIEVGSGNSSLLLRAAGGGALDLTCIDPAPRRAVDAAASRIVRESVVGVKADVFSALRAGDILFIDGSHYSFNGTDTPYLFLEILPTLPPGVIVHVHDIHLPNEYDHICTERHYNEQYLLAAMLLAGTRWKTLLPVQYCHRQGLLGDGTSYWMRRS